MFIMPLFYSHSIDENTRLAIWHITEEESFFLDKVPTSRSITHWHKRLQHLAGRYLLQFLYPDFPLPLIQVATTKKPYLPEESHHFSISHCGNYAAAIVSTRHRVGIDIEIPVEKLQVLAAKFVSASENKMLPLMAGKRIPALTLIWSAKETMFKWYSHGAVDFRQHLKLHSIKPSVNNHGSIEASFCKDATVPVTVHFTQFDDLVLTWLVQDW